MSKVVKILDGQTMIDIAMQELGDASFAVDIAVLNDKKITDDLVSGSEITVPDFDKSYRSLINLFADDANKPASGLTAEEQAEREGGIGFWFLENDFVVQ